MAKIEINDAPADLSAEWEKNKGRDIHFITGPYLRALEAALTFYADKRNWQGRRDKPPSRLPICSAVEEDGGEKARKALDMGK